MSTTLRDFPKLRSEKLWAEFSFPKTVPSGESDGIDGTGGLAAAGGQCRTRAVPRLEPGLPSLVPAALSLNYVKHFDILFAAL